MNLFSYNTICTQLSTNTKTLIITLNRPEQGNPINLELLFELQSILNWASSKMEICSILINSSAENFSEGMTPEFVEKADIKKLIRLREELFQVHKLMINSPQTIVCDLKHGAKNIAADLSLGADIRIASIESQITFNHLEVGVPPFYSMRLAEEIFTRAELQNFINYTKPISINQLLQNAFLIDVYDSSNQTETVEKYLRNIQQQAQLPRVQTKFLHTRKIIQQMDQDFQLETNLFQAACATQDWQNKNSAKLTDVKKAVKMTLIQGGTDQ